MKARNFAGEMSFFYVDFVKEIQSILEIEGKGLVKNHHKSTEKWVKY